MPWIETRRNKAGETTSVRVVWREQNPETGKHEKRHHSCDTEEEAERFIAIMDGDRARGVAYNLSGAQQPFEVYAEKWYSQRPKDPTLQSTQGKERSYLNARILPYWGRRPIGGIRSGEIQHWVNQLGLPLTEEELALAATGQPPRPAHLKTMAPSSVLSVYSVFAAIMNQAARDHCLPMGSPCPPRSIRMPEIISRERFLTHGELDHLLHVAENFPEDFPVVYIAAFTGMRIGEIAALRRPHYNPLAKWIRVEEVARRGKGAPTGPPKGTRRGGRPKARTIEIDGELVKVINAHLAGHSSDYIFPGSVGLRSGGARMDPNKFSTRRWAPIREAAGFPDLHFHDLRHTHISHLLAAGEPPINVAERVGDSLKTMIDVYSHFIPNRNTGILDRLRASRSQFA